jgi:hypothetical protein
MLHGAGEQVNSENVTVPEAPIGETDATKVTGCPYVDGFGLEVRVVVVAVLLTVCTRPMELPTLLLSPL